jgi:DNA polymerase-3 subunit gamma/tau
VPEDLPELADIQRLALEFDPQEVQLYYQIAVHGRNEIGLAPDEYAGFTMTLLRMLAFRPGQGGAEQAAPAAGGAAPAARPVAAPARAAAAAVASHAAVAPPPRPAAPAATASAPLAAPAPPAGQPGGQPGAPAQAAPAMTSARAAINAALEAARAASGARQGGAPKRPAPAPEAPAAPQAGSAPARQGQDTSAAPARMTQAAPAPQAHAPSAAPAAAPTPGAAPPWQQGEPDRAPRGAAAPGASASGAAARPQAAIREQAQVEDEDGPPSWVTEFSDDTALAADAPAAVAAPAALRASAKAPHAYVITPVPAIGWDGNWPGLAATLPLRGVAQQLALQTELVECGADTGVATFRLRVPIDTLRASGNSEKLAAALQERFPDVRVNVEIDIGPVWYTAGAEARAHREECQRQAEQTVAADPFVQSMARAFDAFVVPGSVRPPASS